MLRDPFPNQTGDAGGRTTSPMVGRGWWPAVRPPPQVSALTPMLCSTALALSSLLAASTTNCKQQLLQKNASGSRLRAATRKSSGKAQFPIQDIVQPCRRVWRLPRVLDLTEHWPRLVTESFSWRGRAPHPSATNTRPGVGGMGACRGGDLQGSTAARQLRSSLLSASPGCRRFLGSNSPR